MRVKTYLTFFAILTITALQAIGQAPVKPLDTGMEGWKFISKGEEQPMDSAWTVEDSVLKCSGEPMGYLVSPESYENYVLTFDWRWSGEEGGNSGLLVSAVTHQEGFKLWPLCVEVQLMTGKAGDIYFLGNNAGGLVENATVKVHQGIPVVHVKSTGENAEKPLGEWNTMEVTAQDGTLSASVNGQPMIEVQELKPAAGQIAFQSEGTPIEFRNIVITPQTSSESAE